jgi:hypothetical protein
MEPRKIELEDREAALARCECCADRQAHIHFYVVTKSKKFKTFGDCLIHTRTEMVKFTGVDTQDFHSFTGGKSREQFLLPDNVRAHAKEIWKSDNYTLLVESVTCYNLMDEMGIAEIIAKENFKGFIKVK